MSRFPSSWDEPYRRPSESQNPNPFARNAGGAGNSAMRPRLADSGFPGTGEAPAAEDPLSGETAAVVGTVLAGAESPRQHELASRIYDRLKAGYGVDDLTGLIDELGRAANEQSQRSAFSRSPSGEALSREASPRPGSSPDPNPFKGRR